MEILKYPDKCLRVKCKNVAKIDESVKKEAEKLLLTLLHLNKISLKIICGIAANQIGFNKRIVVLKRLGNKYVTMINPKIVKSWITFPSLEFCFSLPGTTRIKKRRFVIKVKYLDLNGKPCSVTLCAATSFTMQQEIDHLNGKLIID